MSRASCPLTPRCGSSFSPGWPFKHSLAQVAARWDDDGDDDDAPIIANEGDDRNDHPVVYLAERTQLGYFPDAVREQLGW